jgi:hypothetical protein
VHECALNFLNSRVSVIVWDSGDGIPCLFACVVDFLTPLRVFPSQQPYGGSGINGVD